MDIVQSSVEQQKEKRKKKAELVYSSDPAGKFPKVTIKYSDQSGAAVETSLDPLVLDPTLPAGRRCWYVMASKPSLNKPRLPTMPHCSALTPFQFVISKNVLFHPPEYSPELQRTSAPKMRI